MSLFFIFNNLHFALEILGALVFIVVSWLSWDAFRIRKNAITASKGIGFILLALWQLSHALSANSEILTYLSSVLFLIGLGFLVWNIILEKPAPKPTFGIVLVLPSVALLARTFNAVAAAGLAVIAFFAYRQYKAEQKLSIKSYWMAFCLLSAGYLIGAIYGSQTFGALWVAGHIFEVAGFFALSWWVWQYLHLRIKEEMTLIFFSSALVISIVVTLAFSTILVGQIETATRNNLLLNARVADLALSSLREESSAKARLIASNAELRKALVSDNFLSLEKIVTKTSDKEGLGMLTIVDTDGKVVIRAHALSRKEDDLSGEGDIRSALSGNVAVAVTSGTGEKFSVRSAAPIFSGEKVIGAVVAGFPLDNAFVDNMKKITGLDISVFEGGTRVSTTELNPDGRTRSIGIKEVNPKVLKDVLTEGKAIALRTEILSRPFLASYVPISSSDGKITGMISSARSQQDILNTASSTNRLTLVTVAILMLLLSAPIYFVTKKISEEAI